MTLLAGEVLFEPFFYRVFRFVEVYKTQSERKAIRVLVLTGRGEGLEFFTAHICLLATGLTVIHAASDTLEPICHHPLALPRTACDDSATLYSCGCVGDDLACRCRDEIGIIVILVKGVGTAILDLHFELVADVRDKRILYLESRMVSRKVDFHCCLLDFFRDFDDVLDERVRVPCLVVVPCEDFDKRAVDDPRHREVGNRAVGKPEEVRGNKRLFRDCKEAIPTFPLCGGFERCIDLFDGSRPLGDKRNVDERLRCGVRVRRIEERAFDTYRLVEYADDW